MRTFQELSEAERKQAEDVALVEVLNAVLEGGLRFDDELNGDGLQARIDAAIAKAEGMQTPWFAGEYVLEATEQDLRGMAQADAFDAVYPDPGERVIVLPRS